MYLANFHRFRIKMEAGSKSIKNHHAKQSKKFKEATMNHQPQFTDNPAASGTDRRYIEIKVDTAKILHSWRKSLFSYEWLEKDGAIKALNSLSESDREKRLAVEEKLQSGQKLPKAILGIGIMDNVEIGSGRAEFLTLAALGVKTLPVHIPQGNESDFKAFLAALE